MNHLFITKKAQSFKQEELHLSKSQSNISQKQKNCEVKQISSKSDEVCPQNIYTLIESNQKVIPGYNFESLFRKKSHIRLARKKIKEQTQKKNPNLKHELGQRQAKNIQKGHWTNQENKLYHWFLQLHNRHFVLKYLRRTDKIFKSMANFIRTREAEQCRSHHQKMQKKYHTFYQILAKLRMDFYSTISPDLLKVELEQNGYKIKDSTLISENQIKNGDCTPRQCKMEQMEDSIGNGQEGSGEQKDHSNILGENYQNGLHFGNLHY